LSREADYKDLSLQGPPLRDVPGFALIPCGHGSALNTHPRDNRLHGASWSLQPEPQHPAWYHLYVESWVYGVQGEMMSMPVLDFLFRPGPEGLKDIEIRQLKIVSRTVTQDEYTNIRAMSVALFFINQINAGHVPDCERILKLHRLYPHGKGI
jgi:hypothetical protein